LRTDADLLQCFTRTHDQEAFTALVQRHGPMVLGVCERLLPDRHEAEDAFQATFLVLVRKSLTLRQPERLAAWLHGVALRIALRLRRRAVRRPVALEGAGLAEARGPGPLEQAALQEVRAILDEEIERLPTRYRLPVVLCYLQGQSYTEAARSLGWPSGTVSVRLARARQTLRARFVRRGLELPASVPASLSGEQPLTSPLPAALLTATVNAGVWCATGVSALSGIVSPHVWLLAEGALQTMWMTKFKITLLMVLVMGLVGTGLSSLAGRLEPRAHAQVPARVEDEEPAPAGGDADQAKEIDALEKQVKALQQRLEERRRQLLLVRQGNALEQIEAALRKLQQANAGDPQRRAAVADFDQAFGRLKQALAGRAASEEPRHASRQRRNLALANVVVPIVSDGRVLQVDLEDKRVLLSTGSREGVKTGQLYRVYQSGKAGPDQTGWVRITQVHAKWSVGAILQEFSPRAPMQPNDFIQIHDDKEPEGLGGGPGRQ
jgi:RNA polymerase sigma factor (sigma-70 family)